MERRTDVLGVRTRCATKPSSRKPHNAGGNINDDTEHFEPKREQRLYNRTVRDDQDRCDHMRDRSVASLVVKSGNAITGILSERDVVGAISRSGGRAPSEPVKGDFPMSSPLRMVIASNAQCDS